MKLQLLLGVLALCLPALGAYLWDESKIIQMQADDTHWQYYMNRGNDIICALKSTDLAAGKQLLDKRNPPSAEAIYGILGGKQQWGSACRQWYWFRADPFPSASDFDKAGWAQALKDLGDPSQREWSCKRWTHYDASRRESIDKQEYKNRIRNEGEGDWRATGAEYSHASHPRGWMIFQPSVSCAVGAHKFWNTGSSTISSALFPDVRQHSDFAWSDWRMGKDDSQQSRLHHCGIMQAADMITYGVLARALVQTNQYMLSAWPAANSVFSADSPEGRALLATPAANECVRFLVQHKQWLGIKIGSNIRVWRGPALNVPNVGLVRFPQFIFDIEDVPADQIKADPPPGWKPPRKADQPGKPNFIPQLLPDGPQPGAPGPSNSQSVVPGPSTPEPVVPGPSTPRPAPPPKARANHEAVTGFSYKVSVENHDENFVRVHTFEKA